ncbi:MAG: type II secretion system protein, partial [Candidatus Margulisiibacteriota bacterium]
MTRSGFTLAEVVVVMGILILLFSISFASLNAYREKISLNVFAHLAATELYSTQCLAMSKCESTSIN